MVRESQRLLTGILSLVLIAGLGMPAFATDGTSDRVTITITGVAPFSLTIPETGEPTGLQTLNLGTLISSGIGSFGESAVELTEPGSGALSDIIVVDPQKQICPPGNSDVCFISDSDTNSGILSTIANNIANAGIPIPTTTMPETGTSQDLSQFLVSSPGISIQVFSDLTETTTTTPVGGTIIPVDMVSLFIAGIMTNAFWMVPTLGGIAGAAIAFFKVKKRK